MQVQALNDAGAERTWTEHMSGDRDDRPELAALLDYARAGDVLMVWRLDRLGRSVPHLLTVIEDLAARGVELRSLTEAIDTTTPELARRLSGEVRDRHASTRRPCDSHRQSGEIDDCHRRRRCRACHRPRLLPKA
jgi:Resolvase, N terminal domain